MNRCFVCCEFVDEDHELLPSPSGSGKMVCEDCYQEIDEDLHEMELKSDGDE